MTPEGNTTGKATILIVTLVYSKGTLAGYI